MSVNTEPAADRRQLLKVLGGILGGLAAGLGLPVGCASDRAPATRVALASLPAEGRLRVLDGENPVELRRLADGSVTGRSLWCTHSGCEVAWSENRALYLCPCHEGVFAADGRPLSGPPPRALVSVPVEVRGGEIVIGFASGESGKGAA